MSVEVEDGGRRADDEGQGRNTKGNGGRRTVDEDKFLLLFSNTPLSIISGLALT